MTGMPRTLLRTATSGLALLALVAPPAATAQDADDDSSADHLVVVDQTPWVVPGGTFALQLRVDDPPAGAQLRMSLHGAVRTRSEFVRTLAGDSLRARITDRTTVPLDDLSQVDGAYPLRIVTGPITGEPVAVELDADDEGVYPVVVELLDADDEVVDRLVTHLVRLPDPDPDEVPIGAVVIVPVHAPPSHLVPGEVDHRALAPLDVVVDALLDHPGARVTIVPTPEALAAELATDPNAARRLAEVGRAHPAIAAPWVRIDAPAWLAAGMRDELARQRTVGLAAATAALGVRPDTSVAVVPPDGGEVAVEAALLTGASVVVVPESDLVPLDERDFPITLTRPFELATDDGTVDALMADAGLQARVGATGDPVLDANRLLADLAVLALDAPLNQRAAVVVLDDDAATDRAFLEALLDGLDQPPRAGAAPLVAPASIDAVLDDVAPAGADGGSDPEDDPLVRELTVLGRASGAAPIRDDLASARADVASYRSVFGEDAPLAADVDEVVLTAAASSLDERTRDAVLGRARAALLAELGDIHPPPRQRVTLTAREGQVQLVVANDTGQPALVALELRGDRLELLGHPDDRLLVELDGPTTRVDLALRARSSGDAPLDLRLTTPDGRIEIGRSRVTVRTTAVSGVGLVLMIAAAVFLVAWWTRTILRERGTARRRHPAHVGR